MVLSDWRRKKSVPNCDPNVFEPAISAGGTWTFVLKISKAEFDPPLGYIMVILATVLVGVYQWLKELPRVPEVLLGERRFTE